MTIFAALAFAEQGIAVFPCGADKKPLTQHGFKDATTNPSTLRMWWTRWPKALIGVPTGSVNGFAICDLDVKNGVNGFEAVPGWEELTPTISKTQNGGAHLWFDAKGAPGNTVGKIAPGVDTRGEGGYIIAPPSYGYTWLKNGGVKNLPKWPIELELLPDEPQHQGNGNGAKHTSKYAQQALNAELGRLAQATPGNRNDTLNAVMFNLWQLVVAGELDGTFVKDQVMRVALAVGLPEREILATQESAIKGGTLHPRAPVQPLDLRYTYTDEMIAEGAIIAPNVLPSLARKLKAGPPTPLDAVPTHLLQVPGVLNRVVEYFNATSPTYQPQFAVQCALAVGSSALGRRWRTDQQNYSSLYFMIIGKSSTGKEHIKTVIDNIYNAAGLRERKGVSGYTSAAGVFSTLEKKPTHICITDEMGLVFQTAQATGQSHRNDAMRQLMEAWGRLHGEIDRIGYSTIGLTDKQLERLNTHISHPAITLVAMTSNESLFENLNHRHIVDGLLPRIIIVKSVLERAPIREIQSLEVPSEIVAWVQGAAHGCGDMTHHDAPMTAPDAGIIPFSAEARELLRAFGEQLTAEMNELDKFDMAEMLGKTRETAMRMSLIVALSCEADAISAEHVQWSIDYCHYYATQAIAALRTNVSENDFDAAVQTAYRIIKKAGINHGATEAELAQASRIFRKLTPRERKDVFQTLQVDYGVIKLKRKSGWEAYVINIDRIEH